MGACRRFFLADSHDASLEKFGEAHSEALSLSSRSRPPPSTWMPLIVKHDFTLSPWLRIDSTHIPLSPQAPQQQLVYHYNNINNNHWPLHCWAPRASLIQSHLKSNLHRGSDARQSELKNMIPVLDFVERSHPSTPEAAASSGHGRALSMSTARHGHPVPSPR